MDMVCGLTSRAVRPNQSSLGGVVRLTHCSVNPSTRKDFCFAINGRLSSQFFYSKSEADMQGWMDAVKGCIEEEEAHETRQLVPSAPWSCCAYE
jgi:hypothetical protein